ncbi:MAG: fused MFS/spermidine synthase, partial [Armatimonadota bacterium]|nr:fused MFS/spermidine synthase [Armatimonadota bacterium]
MALFRKEAVLVLEVVVFTSGGVLLALEIIASRVLAPYFGNSVYVWGSLISVFLGALSAGYYLGGKIADRWPSLAVFSGVVFLAGLLVTPIPLFAPAVLETIALRDYGPRANPLLAAFILFALPSVVMGTISPYAVRLRAKTVATMGNVAGRLYALSTVGSIAGTLLAAFVLIQLTGVRLIIHLLGLLLLALGVLSWLQARRLEATVAAFLVLVLAGAMVTVSSTGSASYKVFERDTVYHRITVTDEGRVRYLKLDNYWQSALDMDDPLRSVFSYTDYMHIPLVFAPHARRALLIGLGGGTIPLQYHESYPQLSMDVVELDPA